MISLTYSFNIEATEDPEFFTFFSPDLQGFTGAGYSVEDCLYRAKHGMTQHMRLLEQQRLPVPLRNARPRVVIENSPAGVTNS